VDGRNTQADVDALAAQLSGSGIRDLYVHAGPYADDGVLDPALRPRATWLVETLHTSLPQVRVQAWLGNVLADDRMDLSSAQTRANVLAGVDDILADGFDGVHFDFEPARNDDQAFLDLLAATHPRTQAQQALLSVATPKLEPHTGARITATLLPTLAEWSAGYTRQVSRFVDQIAIMSYDTALPSERAYRGFIRRQTEIALQSVPASVDLLIGAPAYHDQKLTRFDSAETMPAAIAGVQLALAGVSRERAVGLALYVDFDATAQDWDSYTEDWAP
jgi:spore germination protein YaaH